MRLGVLMKTKEGPRTKVRGPLGIGKTFHLELEAFTCSFVSE